MTGNSTIEINGGTVSLEGSFGSGRLATGTNSININGGTTTALELFFGDGGSTTTFNFGGTTAGTLTAGSFRAAGVDQEVETARRVNWLTGTLMTMTLTAADEWAEAEWNANRLFFNGSSSTALGKSWADVTNSSIGLDGTNYFVYDGVNESLSLAVVPEPSTSLLLLGGMTALVLLRRHKRD